MQLTQLVGIRITPEHHQKLNQMALNRSAELGRRVSAGFVVQELLDLLEQTDDPRKRSAEIFGSTD
jgi:hypothetical protein